MSIINKKISLLFKRKSFHQLLWSYQSNFKGSGLVYKESRPYMAGDPYHRIDRRTSAKKQELYLKEFEEERMLRVLFVTHGGESMHFCSTAPTKREMIASLWTLIGTIALQQGDQMSYFAHTKDDSFYLPLNKSPHQTKRFEQQYTSFSATGYPTPEQTAMILNTYRIRHHLIIRISDQLITTPQPHLQALAKCNDVLYCHLLDPFEYDADPAHFWAQLMQVGHRGIIRPVSKNSTQSYKDLFQEHITASERLLASRGITSTHASTQVDPLLICMKLFQKHTLKR